jgi:hypothetical protein
MPMGSSGINDQPYRIARNLCTLTISGLPRNRSANSHPLSALSSLLYDNPFGCGGG